MYQNCDYTILLPESAKTDREHKPKGWGKRHTFALLSFLGFAVVFAQRVNLSVTIVKMVSQNTTSAVSHHNNSYEETTVCYLPQNVNLSNDIISQKVNHTSF